MPPYRLKAMDLVELNSNVGWFADNRRMKMTKTLLAAAALALFATSVQAEVYNYACKVDNTPPNNGVHLYALKIDTKAKTLTWRGTVFKNLKSSGTGGLKTQDCAKYCFEATGRDTDAFVSTATQGYASLSIEGHGPGGIEFDCEMVRP
jgi:hypothetical protein